jgi:hypothetical protein
MPFLKNALQAWGKDNFSHVLKKELLNLKTADLPLYKATEHGGYVGENNLNFSIQSFSKDAGNIKIKLFVFFYEIVIGCNCGDDPAETPITCEMFCNINIKTGLATFTLID